MTGGNELREWDETATGHRLIGRRRYHSHKFRELVLVGVADHLRDAGKSREFLGGALGVATGNHDAGLWILAMDAADGGARILIGGCRHGAGIQDDHFGLIERRGAFQAALFELALDGGAVGLGRAAAKILYVVTCHRTIVAALSRQSSGEKQASGSGTYPSRSRSIFSIPG